MSRGISATALDAGKVCSWRNIVTGTAVANVASPSFRTLKKGNKKTLSIIGRGYPAMLTNSFFVVLLVETLMVVSIFPPVRTCV